MDFFLSKKKTHKVKMPNISWFQFFKYENLLIFSVLCHWQKNIFEIRTKPAI